ncbi:NAD(P)-binding protein [Wolfiporia cocos MD-104 SS10]|uniref:NAD(P)-binding protein n=1 Tax=Wolfiporia cocos (strain MD-104) TaxID=742152 RepID=A0A2H3JVN3_WOLCO|nr:NAD(P)-binding protein [Wolfiporia cocos MD-104 SS10]
MASTAAATIKRVALITGASQGISKCIAQRLASDGLRVALNDIAAKRDQLQDVAAQIRTSGGEAIVMTADVSREDDVKAMTTQVVQEAGGLDVMVANAGILGPFKPLLLPLCPWRHDLLYLALVFTGSHRHTSGWHHSTVVKVS